MLWRPRRRSSMRTPEIFEFSSPLECLAKQRELAVIGKPFSTKVIRGKDYAENQRVKNTVIYQITVLGYN